MSKPSWQRGIPLDKTLQERLRALIEAQGDEKKAAAIIGVSPIAILRAAAGVGLRRGTIHMIENGLAIINLEHAA